MLVVLAAALGESRAGAQAYDLGSLSPGERALVSLPLEFEVLPGNRFYLYGKRVFRVQLATAEGDSLYLNGVPILPVRTREIPPSEVFACSDEEGRKVYGDVPFVESRVAEGVSVGNAASEYLRAREELMIQLGKAYYRARASGADISTAGRAAFERLQQLEGSALVDWERGPKAVKNCIRLFWLGMRGAEVLCFNDAPEETLQRARSEEDKRYMATMIYEALAVREPCWCLIGAGGFRIYSGKQDVSRLERELDAVLREREPRPIYLLDEHVVREILEQEGR